MKILISQQEIKLPPFNHAMDALERTWYWLLAGHELIVAPNIPKWHFEHIEYDCLVLTGGNDSINRHLTENRLYQLAESQGKPIVGFCHGAFAVNDLAAGINSRIDGHVDQDHIIIMNGQTHMVNSFHSQCMAKIPPGFEVVATDKDGNAEAIRHLFKPIWAVVWHPERMEKPVLPQELADFLRTDLSVF